MTSGGARIHPNLYRSLRGQENQIPLHPTELRIMKMKRAWFVLAVLLALNTAAFSQDPNFYIFLCLGQSNMEGFPGIEPQDKVTVDKRFQVLAAVDCPNLGRTKGNWYDAVPPLCRRSTGLCPGDYFGRTMVTNLPEKIRVGVVNVSVAGCKIELFDKDNYQTYAATAAPWMKNIIKEYSENPYAHLVEVAKLAQKEGVIKGILLHQGESNTNDKQWPAKVKGVYDNLIKDLNLKAESVPLLAGEVVNADQQGACASMNSIIAELPKTIPNSYVISSQGCTSRPDHLHFTAAGYRELGERYAEKMLSLLGDKIKQADTQPATQPVAP
jgi:alpha-L-fucosidase 2